MGTKKRQDLPAGLWVVATPLGNLSDLTERARDALAFADRVLCEDTRRTGALLNALEITARLERFDAHSGAKEIAHQIERLKQGESLALVTDAGTPAISDPGARLVAAARENEILITPVPGPSAVTALLSVAGFAEAEFAFGGFFPRKEGDRSKLLTRAQSPESPRVWVWFESPNRIVEALELLARSVPHTSRLVVAKELTKLHEKTFGGTALEVATAVAQEIEREGELGEWAMALEFSEASGNELTGDSEVWIRALECLSDCGVAPTEAAKSVSKRYGIDRKLTYEAYLRVSGKK